MGALVALRIFVSSEAAAQDLDSLEPGHWMEVPSSHLRDVVPVPEPPGITGPSSVMVAWSGGVYDSVRDRLVVWGGGHGDYSGNELYAFDVDAGSWSVIWGPSPVIPPLDDTCRSTYDDGNPASRHTYEGLEYIPTLDTMFAQGGSLWCGPGGGDSLSWLFDFSTNSWQQAADAPSTMLGVVTAYDPVTDHVFHQGQLAFSEYDPAADSYTERGEVSAGWWNSSMAAAIEPDRRLFVAVGGNMLRIWDLTSWQLTEPASSGGEAVIGARPGVDYDPVLGRIVAWGGGASLYSLDLDTMTWFEHAPAADNTVEPTEPPSQGTYGRFRYMPSNNAYVVVNSVDENVFFYKLSEGSGTPVPDPNPDPNLPRGGDSADGGGCGCRLAATPRRGEGSWLLALALLAIGRRTRAAHTPSRR